ncbi:Ig-like domain-containing protein [Draconibacterium sp.]|jgi:hypothetical protein
MKIKGKIPFFIVAALAWIVIISSCANPGMPVGGAKDTIPPVLLKTEPGYRTLNYKGNNVKLTFNEYLAIEDISESLVISPPMIKKPLIRTKSKTLVIEFNEDLKDSTTYSLDFKNSIADNNEKNPIEDFRFSFSTGPVFDSLRVSGRLMNAFNLEPIDKGLVLLHKNLHDSAFFRSRPNYIAKTDKEGVFMIDNIAPGSYHLFSLLDNNNNLLYDEGAEEMAFEDSLIIPSAEYVEEVDTISTASDTIVVMGHTHFFPEPVYLHQFTEDIFDQYLDKYERNTRYKCTFVFNESVKDSFQLNLINNDANNWYLPEYNENVDSLTIWISDTTVARLDTLLMEVAYLQLDSLKQLYLQRDTVEMNFTDKEVSKSIKKKKLKDGEEEEPEPVVQFNWQTDINSSIVELNNKIGILAPEPIFKFDSTQILLYLAEDTLKNPLSFQFEKDTLEYRKYDISYKWEPGTVYILEIDSAASVNIFGVTSKKLKSKFTAREEDYYGTITLNLTGVEVPVIAQLVSNNDAEKVIVEKNATEDGKVEFKYLKPEKYKAKIIFDRNGNGKWDTGSYQDKYQPERVLYINEVVKVRSNWEKEYNWDLKPDVTFVKKIRDIEEEEKQRKEAEEKARKEQEQGESPQQMQNLMQGGGGSGSFR